MNKPWLTKGNIFNVVLIAALALIVFVPPVKALFIRGLMTVGLFKADVTEPAAKPVAAPDVRFEDPAGRTINLSQLKGKVVVLNFWATWCPPCLAEMPSLNSLHEKFKADPNVAFVMVDADGDLAKSQKFMADKGYELPLYKANDLPNALFSGTLPTILIINKAGNIVFRHEGMANYDSDEVEGFLKKLEGE